MSTARKKRPTASPVQIICREASGAYFVPKVAERIMMFPVMSRPRYSRMAM